MSQDTGLVPQETPAWYSIEKTGLRFTPGIVPSYEECEESLYIFGTIYKTSRWALGDLLNLTEAYYGEKYAQAMEVTGLRYGTLANYAAVSRAIPIDRRWEELPISYHSSVMGLPEPEQDRLLQKAHDQDLNREEFRLLVKATRALTQEDEPKQSVAQLTLRETVVLYLDALDALDDHAADEYLAQMRVLVGRP